MVNVTLCAEFPIHVHVTVAPPVTRISGGSKAKSTTFTEVVRTGGPPPVMTVIESAWYKQLFPRTRIDLRKNTEAEFETTARGFRLGTSVGGTLTGRGGNLITIDDPMKPAEAMSETKRANVSDWYDTTLSSRLDHKTEDAIVLIMQRLHVDDLVGHVLEKGPSWTHLNLPAIADSPQEIELGNGRT